MPETGWINDPNGVCYFKGKYHLFYQYNPYDVVWANPFWGHAQTSDFITYEYLPAALAPGGDPPYGCFSGGATLKNEKLILCYTRHYTETNDEEQFVSTSSDGVNFISANTPLLDADALSETDDKKNFRDPNPVYINGVYYLFVGSRDKSGNGQILVYRSEDMERFTFHMKLRHESFGIMAECPDMFRLDDKDVLIFSSLGYKYGNFPNGNKQGSYALVGNIDFKEKKYNFETLTKLDYGTDFYAPQTLETEDGRRIMFAWLDTWNDNSFMREINNRTSGRYVLPRELYVKNGRVCVKPVSEIDGYMKNNVRLEKGKEIIKNFCFKAYFSNDSFISFTCGGGYIGITKSKGKIILSVNGRISEAPCEKDEVLLTVFSDFGSLEIFTEEGIAVSSQILFAGNVLTLNDVCGVSFEMIKIIEN